MDMTTLATLGASALATAPEYGLAALSAVCASSGFCVPDGRRMPALLWSFCRSSAGDEPGRNWPSRNRPRRNQRGEGVISAAIAVLIIASLGALMWVGFKALWENAEETTNSEISKIGK